jgi:hypothetical protein
MHVPRLICVGRTSRALSSASTSSALKGSFGFFWLRSVRAYTIASLSRRFIAMLTAVEAINLPSRGSFGSGSPTGSHMERMRMA